MTIGENAVATPKVYDDTNCDYYDCSEPESLSHETVADAIESFLDGYASLDCDMVALIVEHAPIEVEGYVREVVSETWKEWTVTCLLERLDERYSEGYGNPEDTEFDTDRDRITLREWLDATLARHPVWACEVVWKREYGAAEVETMMREHRPEWFEGTIAP